MTHELACPGCGRGLEIPELPAGARIRCPACSHVFTNEDGQRAATSGGGVSFAGPPASRIPSLALAPTPVASGAIPESPGPPTSASSLKSPAQLAREPRWQLRTPEGLVFGPVERTQLDQWVREGRVTADCQLRNDSDDRWQAADAIYPVLIERTPPGVADPRLILPATNATRSLGARSNDGTSVDASSIGAMPGGGAGQIERTLLRPHRGPLILTLALVGLLVQCPIFSVLAWVMGSSDLEEIYVGRMDPAGLKATRAGRMLGMIMSLFWIIMAVVLVSVFVLVVAVR